MNRQQRRALERKNRKESNPVRAECLKKLDGILGKRRTFRDDDGDLAFSWERENRDRLEIHFHNNNRVGYTVFTDSEIAGGGTEPEKITIVAEAFKAGASGLDLVKLG